VEGKKHSFAVSTTISLSGPLKIIQKHIKLVVMNGATVRIISIFLAEFGKPPYLEDCRIVQKLL
jgi:hypothetical protein